MRSPRTAGALTVVVAALAVSAGLTGFSTRSSAPPTSVVVVRSALMPDPGFAVDDLERSQRVEADDARRAAEQQAEHQAEHARQHAARAATDAARRAERERASRAARRAPVVAGDDVWSALARCESGGNPSSVSSSGAYRGAFQFSRATWASVGESGDPAAASYSTQLAAAQRLQARSGWGQWPHCSRRLGLR